LCRGLGLIHIRKVFFCPLGRITLSNPAAHGNRRTKMDRNHESKSVTQKAASALRCSSGTECVAYPALGQPAKLSRSNPGPRCFACEEHWANTQLRWAAEHRKAHQARPSERNEPKECVCAKRFCNRPAVEREGEMLVCREHGVVGRAVAVRARRRASVLTCERVLRSAIASGDELLERKWARLLLEAEARLVWAEEDVARAEAKARSEYARQE
jgi:hypothetical protein